MKNEIFFYYSALLLHKYNLPFIIYITTLFSIKIEVLMTKNNKAFALIPIIYNFILSIKIP